MTLVFLCSGSVCESCLWTHVVAVAVETLCFCGISGFVFTVTMENEKGLLSPSYRWKYVVSPGKLMTEPGNEPMIQFWMSIPPLGKLRGCRAEPCLFLAQEVGAVLACCPQFWPFRLAPGDISKMYPSYGPLVLCQIRQNTSAAAGAYVCLTETFTSTYCFNFMETLEQFETSVQGHRRHFFTAFSI